VCQNHADFWRLVNIKSRKSAVFLVPSPSSQLLIRYRLINGHGVCCRDVSMCREMWQHCTERNVEQVTNTSNTLEHSAASRVLSDLELSANNVARTKFFYLQELHCLEEKFLVYERYKNSGRLAVGTRWRKKVVNHCKTQGVFSLMSA